MKRRTVLASGLPFIVLPFAGILNHGCAGSKPLLFVCGEDNDIYKAVASSGLPVSRFDDSLSAVKMAPRGSGICIFADGYPETTTTVVSAVFTEAEKNDIRLYIEYPSSLPGMDVGEPRDTDLERGVIVTDGFGDGIAPMDILYMHGCRFVPAKTDNPMIVVAKVAGFDTAVYGLNDTETFPVLFSLSGGRALIATTKLSGCRTGRFAPYADWISIWRWILSWCYRGYDFSSITWTSSVDTAFRKDDAPGPDAEKSALSHGIEWFFNARLLVHPEWSNVYEAEARSWPDRVGDMPDPSWQCGDGSLGLLEGFSSKVDYRGYQKVRWWKRCDCNAEVAGAMALAGSAMGDSRFSATGANMCDWLFDTSIMTRGTRLDPKHPAFGLYGWNDVAKYWRDMNGYEVYYGDDNARALLGIMAAAASLGTDRWDEGIARCILGNFRTSGTDGFRRNRIDEPDLVKNGWRHYYNERFEFFAPHYQSYLWACYLWAYRVTEWKPLFERAKTAIRMTMEAYPEKWHWTNGIQQERARMLLPLSWLVRIEDTDEHRGWLRFMAGEILSDQDACGAIREEIGASPGSYGPPATNALYGTNEAPLIHTNGDPLADLLYTTNFAFLGLHEAAAATGEAMYREAEDRLAGFFVGIQVKSDDHPELSGAWFRAFDYKRWEHWASNSDAGWGVWSTETGWTQGWITSILALRQMKTSLWEKTAATTAGTYIEKLRVSMLR